MNLKDTLNTNLNKWLSGVKTDLIDNYERLGLKASGEWARSLEQFVEPNKSGFKIGITGKNYTQWIENGRNQNKDQSLEGIKKWVGWAGSTFLKQWVIDKGLSNKLNSYAVAYKIAREGWKVPNKYNAGGLVSDIVTTDRINELNKSLSIFTVQSFKSDILNDLKK